MRMAPSSRHPTPGDLGGNSASSGSAQRTLREHEMVGSGSLTCRWEGCRAVASAYADNAGIWMGSVLAAFDPRVAGTRPACGRISLFGSGVVWGARFRLRSRVQNRDGEAEWRARRGRAGRADMERAEIADERSHTGVRAGCRG